MKKKFKLFKGVILMLITLLTFIGCGKTEDKASDKAIKLAWTSDVKTTDPSHAYDGASKDLLANIMEGLFMLDSYDQPIPALVENYTYDPDTYTYVFKIKKGQKWYKSVDGQPVATGAEITANDFEYSWKRTANPKTASQQAQFLAYASVKNYNKIVKGEASHEKLGIKALDKYTLEVQLDRSVPYFLSFLTVPSFYPINKAFVDEIEKAGKTFGTSVETTLSTGAYILTNWKTDESLDFTKNNEYWNTSNVEVEKISITINKDPQSNRNLFESNYIDKIELSNQDVQTYRDRNGFRSTLGSAVTSIKFNVREGVQQNKDLRQAISYAIDRKPYIDVILNNGSKVANGIIPSGFTFSPEGKDFRTDYKGVSYNLDLAKKHFKKAQNSLGKDITLELLLTDSQGDKKNGEYIQDQLETNLPGLIVKLKQVPFKNRLDLENKGNYQMVLCTYGLNYVDPIALLELWTSHSSINNAFYKSEKYDSLIEKAKSEKDLSKRWNYLLEAEKVFVEEDAIKIPIVQGAKTFVVSNRVDNYQINKTAYADVWKTITLKK